jgi:hypothetical protein
MTRRCFLNKIMSKRLEEVSIFSGSDQSVVDWYASRQPIADSFGCSSGSPS